MAIGVVHGLLSLLLLAATASARAEDSCVDAAEAAPHCALWASQGECEANPAYMRSHCAHTCGQCPTADSTIDCVDRDQSGSCAAWAASGECANNPAFMKIKCARSCGTCDMLDFGKRCPMPGNDTAPAVPPGSMAETFERALSLFPELDPEVLSTDPYVVSFDNFVQPDEIEALLFHGEGRFVRSTASGGRKGDEFVPLTSVTSPRDRTRYRVATPHGHSTWPPPTRPPRGPPRDHEMTDHVLIPEPLAAQEIRTSHTGDPHLPHRRSAPPTQEIRTSHTTWCDTPSCLADPAVKRLTERMSKVTRVPSNNSEFIQLLRYMPCPHATHPDCQFYRRHHDTIPELAQMPCGPRVYTFFLYLSDVPADGVGGTRFDLGFTVQPKAGRAVLWPATFNDRPFTKDDRTHHEALPVTRGVKYAANFWVHQYDYVSAHQAGCTA